MPPQGLLFHYHFNLTESLIQVRNSFNYDLIYGNRYP